MKAVISTKAGVCPRCPEDILQGDAVVVVDLDVFIEHVELDMAKRRKRWMLVHLRCVEVEDSDGERAQDLLEVAS